MDELGNVTSMLERMRKQREQRAREAGFDTVEAHEQHLANVAHAEWERVRPHAIAAARFRILRKSGSLVSADIAETLAKGEHDHTRSVEHARRWLKADKPILVLCGNPGTGKSVAAAWALLENHADEIDRAWSRFRGTVETVPPSESAVTDFARQASTYPSVVVHAPRIPQSFDPWRGETENDRPLLRWDHPFLVIDDLGTEQVTSRWSEAFGHLIDERLASSRCRTIVTTNLPKSEIRRRYGDRIADRWNAHSVAVQLNEESKRGKAQGL